MIAVLSGAGCQFDRPPDELLMDPIPVCRKALGRLLGWMRRSNTGKRNCYRSNLQELAAIRALHSFVVPRLRQCLIGRTLKLGSTGGHCSCKVGRYINNSLERVATSRTSGRPSFPSAPVE